MEFLHQSTCVVLSLTVLKEAMWLKTLVKYVDEIVVCYVRIIKVFINRKGNSLQVLLININ